MNALLIEDDELACRAMGALLRGVGFEVQEAGSVKLGLSYLEGGPDLVVLDLKLPDGDGLKILRHIRGLQSRIRVAVVTGTKDAERLEQLQQQRPDAIFAKPLVFTEFYGWLAEELTFSVSPDCKPRRPLSA